MTEDSQPDTAVGVIGGSGLYELEGLTDIKEIAVETPFGKTSDAIISGRINGRRVYFLPRHGRGHRILPSEVNHRANIWALRSLNVRWIIAVTAVGSLREEYHPRDIVLPDQFLTAPAVGPSTPSLAAESSPTLNSEILSQANLEKCSTRLQANSGKPFTTAAPM